MSCPPDYEGNSILSSFFYERRRNLEAETCFFSNFPATGIVSSTRRILRLRILKN